MLASFSLFFLLQADGSGGAPGAAPAPLGGGLLQLLPLFVMLYFVAYFLMIRPQRKQQRAHEALLDALQKNDEVRTSGGIYGKVISVERERGIVTLKVDEQHNVRLRVARAAIVEVVDKVAGPEKQQKAEKAGAS